MSTNKFLQSLSEDPQLEKQIGCMTGILQLFDRHQVLTGRRLYGHKRISAGARSVQQASSGSPRSEENGASGQISLSEEMLRPSIDPATLSKTPLEPKETSRHSSIDNSDPLRPFPIIKDAAGVPGERNELARLSVDARESSRARHTLDSSRSLHEGRMIPRKSFDIGNNVKGVQVSKDQPSVSVESKNSVRPSSDIRDIVMASFHRDTPRLSTDKKARDEAKDSGKAAFPPKLLVDTTDLSTPSETKDTSKTLMKLKNSSSGRDVSSSFHNVKGSYNRDIKSKEPARTPMDLNESLRLLAKLREAPWNFIDSKDVPNSLIDSKEGPRFSFSKDAPRSSYDGSRDAPRSSSFEYKEALKGSQRIREAPRLSLDGKLASNKPSLVELRDCPSSTDKNSTTGPLRNATDTKVTSCSILNLGNQSSSTSQAGLDFSADGKRGSTNVVARLMGLEELPATLYSSQLKSESRKLCTETKHFTESPTLKSSEETLQSSLSQDGRKKALKSPSPLKCQEQKGFLPSFRQWESNQSFYDDEDKIVQQHCNADGSRIQLRSSAASREKVTPKPLAASKFSLEGYPKQQDVRTMPQHLDVQSQSPTYLNDLWSPSKMCDQFDQLQSADAFYKEIEKRLQKMGLRNSEHDLRAFKHLLESIQLKGLGYPPQMKHPREVDRDKEASRQLSIKPDYMSDAYSYQENCDEHRQSPSGQHIPEWKQRSRKSQEQQTPDCSRSAPPVQYRLKTGNSSGQGTDASIVIIKPPARHEKVGYSYPDRFEREKNYIHVPNSCRGGAARSGNRDSNSASNRATGTTVTTGRLNKSPSSFSTAPFRDDSVANDSGIIASPGTIPSAVIQGNPHKQNQKPANVKKIKAVGSVMKDKEESRAILVMHSLKSQPARAGSSGVGRSGIDREKKLGNDKKSLNRIDASDIHNRAKMKKMNKMADPNRGTWNENMSDASADFTESSEASWMEFKASEYPSAERSLSCGLESPRVECSGPVALVRDDECPLKPSRAQTKEEIVDFVQEGVNPTTEELGSGRTEAGRHFFSSRTEEKQCQLSNRSLQLRVGSSEEEDRGLKTAQYGSPSAEPLKSQNQSQDCPIEDSRETACPAIRASLEDFYSYNDKCSSGHTVEIPEQPSPVSVLDASLYKDDHSPLAPQKCALKFQELEVSGSYNGAEDEPKWECIENVSLAGMDVQEQMRLILEEPEKWLIHMEGCEKRPTVQKDEDLEYIEEVLAAAGLMELEPGSVPYRSSFPVRPELFLILEQKRKSQCKQQSDWEEDKLKSGVEILSRRLLFDTVATILKRKLHPCTIHSHLSPNPLEFRECRGASLAKEVREEIGQLQSRPSEDICDTLLGMLEWDLADSTSPWKENRVEKAEIALDMERLIFKDLIDETVRDLSHLHRQRFRSASHLDPAATTRKQLFVFER